MDKQFVISLKTILLSLAVLLALYITYELRGVLALLFIALLLVISLESAVQYFSKLTFLNKPLPRGVAVFIVYVLFILVLVLAFTTAVPLIVSQFQNLIDNFSFFLRNIEINGQSVFESLSFLDVLGDITDNRSLSSVLVSSVSFVSSFLSVIVISIYMSLDWLNIKARLLTLFKKHVAEDIHELIVAIEGNIGSWVKGQLALMLAVGVLSFCGMFIAGVNYPLALGFISGVLEIVPVLGPFFASVIATAVGFAQSPVKGIIALGVSILVQQLENNLLVPKIMEKVSGFSPLVILLALLIGSEFFGIIGAILAVPITMILGIIFKRFVHYPTLKE